MKADYELRHSLYGQQGSLWERQVDVPTRQRIRSIVAEAGHPAMLSRLDKAAAGALNESWTPMEDVFFRFVDGEFAVIGLNQFEYSHRRVFLEDGTPVYVGYRSGEGTYSADPLPSKLSRLTDEFLSKVAEDQDMFLSDQSRDWYLVPVPSSIVPIVIQGKNAGEYLVQGVDFLAFEGYIAMIDAPTSALPIGVVKVLSANVRATSPNMFVLSAPTITKRNKWIAEYAYKAQSLEACKRAAAEYAGLYVFQSADVVLNVNLISGTDNVVYNTAAAGPITIDYPHVPLVANQPVAAGHIICQKFELVTTRYDSTEDLRKYAFSGWVHPIELDGILPVKGLTWDGVSEVMLTNGGVNPDAGPHSGKIHIRLMFDGDTGPQEEYWTLSALRERATGVFLVDELGDPGLPTSVNFWAMLNTFYGSRLALAIVADHGAAINGRLREFLLEHHPKSCNLLLSIEPS